MKYLAPIAALPIALLMCSTAMAGDACSSSTTPAPDDSAFSVFYDAFTVAGPGTHTCDWTAPVALPADTFGVYSAEYRGSFQEGDTAVLTTEHSGDTTVTTLGLDPDTGDYYEKQYAGTGNGIALTDSITLAIENEDGSGYVDSADYALLGTTTLGDVEETIGGLADVEAGIVTHLNATAGLLTGPDAPSNGENSVGLLGAIGSHTVGVTGHATIGEGLSLDGGVAGFAQGAGDLEMSGVLAAAKLRYFAPDEGGMRWFGALGVTGAKANLDITRHYDVDYTDPGLADEATITSSTDASLLTVSAEAGVLVAPDAGNSFRLSGEVAQSFVNVDGFTEAFSEENLFHVSVADRESGYTVVKAKAGWTTALTSNIDLTLSAALGQSFANDDYTAKVLYVGDITVDGTSESFAEAEARLGWAVADNADLDLFAKGSFGAESGSHVQAGSEFRLKF
jgi:hypothetical protein